MNLLLPTCIALVREWESDRFHEGDPAPAFTFTQLDVPARERCPLQKRSTPEPIIETAIRQAAGGLAFNLPQIG